MGFYRSMGRADSSARSSGIMTLARNYADLRHTSVVEAEAQLHEDLARVIPVKASEGGAVIEFDAPVGDVQRVQ